MLRRQTTGQSGSSTDSILTKPLDRLRNWWNTRVMKRKDTNDDGERDEIAMRPIAVGRPPMTKDLLTIEEILPSDFEMLYELGRIVGEGEFARVRLGKCRQTGKRVALKQLSGLGEEGHSRHAKIMQEVKIHAVKVHSNAS